MKSYKQVFKRREKKYLLDMKQYEAVKNFVNKVMKEDKFCVTTILNLYYDTPDFRLIRRSLEKPKYKEKLRVRSYGIPDDDSKVFIELKKKFDKVVYKRRIEMGYEDAMDFLAYCKTDEHTEFEKKEDEQIKREIAYFMNCYPELKPRMAISYDRLVFAGIKNRNLRITFDKNLNWRDYDLDLKYGNTGIPIIEKDQRLMEIKMTGSMPMELSKVLSDAGIFSQSFSKYGRGYMEMEGARCSIAY